MAAEVLERQRRRPRVDPLSLRCAWVTEGRGIVKVSPCRPRLLGLAQLGYDLLHAVAPFGPNLSAGPTLHVDQIERCRAFCENRSGTDKAKTPTFRSGFAAREYGFRPLCRQASIRDGSHVIAR
jgi:hypothetical protein